MYSRFAYFQSWEITDATVSTYSNIDKLLSSPTGVPLALYSTAMCKFHLPKPFTISNVLKSYSSQSFHRIKMKAGMLHTVVLENRFREYGLHLSGIFIYVLPKNA